MTTHGWATGQRFLFFGCLLAATAVARGAPITYQFGGVITSDSIPQNVWAGQRFSGTFTYDPNASSWVAPTAESRLYDLGQTPKTPGAVADASGLTLQINGQSVYSQTGGLEVVMGGRQSDLGSGPYTSVVVTSTNADKNPLQVDLGFVNLGHSVFGSLDLPTSLQIADFTETQMDVRTNLGTLNEDYVYLGRIDTLTLVPEPAALAVWFAVFGGGVWMVRRTRST